MTCKAKISDVKVLVWDVDGTLYRPEQKLHDAIRHAEIQTVADYLKISHSEASDRFYSLYRKVSPSGTKTAAHIAGISVTQAAAHMESLYDRTIFIKPDLMLVKLFRQLAAYDHYILSNGAVTGIKELVVHLGIDPQIFREIITSETVGDNKPSTVGFEYIISKTGRKPSEHLMIGDRDEVDIIPGNRAGMQTCKVWVNDHDETEANYRCLTVYDVVKILRLEITGR